MFEGDVFRIAMNGSWVKFAVNREVEIPFTDGVPTIPVDDSLTLLEWDEPFTPSELAQLEDE